MTKYEIEALNNVFFVAELLVRIWQAIMNSLLCLKVNKNSTNKLFLGRACLQLYGICGGILNEYYNNDIRGPFSTCLEPINWYQRPRRFAYSEHDLNIKPIRGVHDIPATVLLNCALSHSLTFNKKSCTAFKLSLQDKIERNESEVWN